MLLQQQAAERRAEQARREAERRQMVLSALEKASTLRQRAHLGEAATVLDQAQAMLGEDSPADLRQRFHAARTELELVNQLDTIRLRRATLVQGKFDYQTAAAAYAAAFQAAGIGKVGDDEASVAARVRASGMTGPLVAALDDWAAVVTRPKTGVWLLGVARQADPDPTPVAAPPSPRAGWGRTPRICQTSYDGSCSGRRSTGCATTSRNTGKWRMAKTLLPSKRFTLGWNIGRWTPIWRVSATRAHWRKCPRRNERIGSYCGVKYQPC
jgi:hypothetical protein